MLQHQVAHVGIFAGQDELRRHARHASDWPHQHFQYIDVMDTDLQHNAARHARRLEAPGSRVHLTESIPTDVAFGLHELAEAAGIDLGFDPAEVTLAPTLVA